MTRFAVPTNCVSLGDIVIPKDCQILYCQHTQITSLEHCPSFLHTLDCDNTQITSLEHCPSSLQTLYCDNTQITSLDSLPVNSLLTFCSKFTNDEIEDAKRRTNAAYKIQCMYHMEKGKPKYRIGRKWMMDAYYRLF